MSDEIVPFQQRRFQDAAPHYLPGRPSYAATLIRRVAELTGLGLRDRVLDLGCGPGQLAAGFAYFAGSVLAMDPEPEMLTLGVERTEGTLTNVTFLQGSSYDLGPQIGHQFGPFRLVTIGRAFHWMDRADTLRRLDALICADGAVVLFSDLHPDVPDNAWLAEFRAIHHRHTGEDRAARRRPDWQSHTALLLESPFSRLERIGVIERRRIPTARIIDRALSMSSASRALIGTRVDELAADIGAMADRLAKDGIVTEVVESTALIAFRRQ